MLDDGGDYRRCRGAGAGREVLPLRIAGVHQVHVGVHTSGHDEQPRRIDDRTAVPQRLAHLHDSAIGDGDIGPPVRA